MNTKNSSTLTKKYKQILSAVHMVYRLVNSTYNTRELTLRLTRLLCQFVKADSSFICLLDPKKKSLFLKAIFDNKINILLDKKKDIKNISPQERRALEGFSVCEPRMIGLPLVADDIIGAVFIKRTHKQPPFTEFDTEMLSVVVEQSVTAIKNLQLYEEQQKVIMGSIALIGKFLKQQGGAFSGAHTPGYFKIVKSLALKLYLREEDINSLYYASILRDTGAIDVPYNILSKTSQLTPEEFKVIREQPARNVELIKPVGFLKPVLPIILYHHEKYDGSGYPSGLKGEQIPLGARIMAVANAFDAMTRERSYKNRLTVRDALKELKANSGTQFDPQIVTIFIQLFKQKKFKNYLNSKK